MQTEQAFLQDQIAVLRKRLNSLSPSEHSIEKPASAKLQRAYELRNKTLINLKKQLVEIVGKEDAFEMFNEAEREAETWWSMTYEGRKSDQP